MAAGATFEPIATTTVASATNQVSFTSIPSTYTDLLIVALCSYNGAGSGDLNIQFNSDTGNNYSATRLISVGSSANSQTQPNRANVLSGEAGIATTALEIHILSYASSVFKNVIISGICSSNSNGCWTTGSWRNTSAITSVQIRAESSPLWAVGSTFTLYGIAGA